MTTLVIKEKMIALTEKSTEWMSATRLSKLAVGLIVRFVIAMPGNPKPNTLAEAIAIAANAGGLALALDQGTTQLSEEEAKYIRGAAEVLRASSELFAAMADNAVKSKETIQ